MLARPAVLRPVEPDCGVADLRDRSAVRRQSLLHRASGASAPADGRARWRAASRDRAQHGRLDDGDHRRPSRVGCPVRDRSVGRLRRFGGVDRHGHGRHLGAADPPPAGAAGPGRTAVTAQRHGRTPLHPPNADPVRGDRARSLRRPLRRRHRAASGDRRRSARRRRRRLWMASRRRRHRRREHGCRPGVAADHPARGHQADGRRRGVRRRHHGARRDHQLRRCVRGDRRARARPT